jgi:integrase
MCDVGKPPLRSKAATLDMLKWELGKSNMAAFDRERVIRLAANAPPGGAGPVTIGMDIGIIRLVLSHAAAVHGLPVKVEPVDLARIALKRLGLIGKGHERDRRPTQDELDRLIAHFDANSRQIAPTGRIIRFAVATAMRQEETCRVSWSDLESRTRMLLIRDRKDPRQKEGNNQRIMHALPLNQFVKLCETSASGMALTASGKNPGAHKRRGSSEPHRAFDAEMVEHQPTDERTRSD